MQQPTFYTNVPSNVRARVYGKSVQRLTYIVLVAMVIALMAAGLYWIQWAAQRSLTLGYPRPVVQLTLLPANTLQLNTPQQFSASATGRNLSYSWDFGDGSSASGASVTHTYQSNGSYTVTVTVTDAIGQSSAASTSVQVIPPKPTASFTYSDYGGGYIQFDASNSSADPSTSIAQYDWNFGDGNSDQTSYAQETHQYGVEGTTYQVTLTVVDATGQASDADTITIAVS